MDEEFQQRLRKLIADVHAKVTPGGADRPRRPSFHDGRPINRVDLGIGGRRIPAGLGPGHSAEADLHLVRRLPEAEQFDALHGARRRVDIILDPQSVLIAYPCLETSATEPEPEPLAGVLPLLNAVRHARLNAPAKRQRHVRSDLDAWRLCLRSRWEASDEEANPEHAPGSEAEGDGHGHTTRVPALRWVSGSPARGETRRTG